MNFRLAALGWILVALSAAAQLPDKDQRGLVPQTLDTPRSLVTFTNLTQWQRHQSGARARILVSAGLWPMPQKTPLNAQITGRIERDGYTVEKVAFESFPGLFVTGNLYRPTKGKAPYPAILNPHGHSEFGRLTDNETFSTVARCIQFARMGMVAFSWDMVGYNDAIQFSSRGPDGASAQAKFYDLHVAAFRDPALQLWNLNLMGIQLWNSIRAVDFVISLPEVNPDAIGCTGESGGGTQTFLLAAVDERIRASAPVVMVSHTMQGGCWCENAPGLRLRHSNLDFAACAAARAQLLVGATGDWTKATTEVEGPAIASVYRFLGRADRFSAVRFEAGHNYNRTSREAVYAWFASTLQGHPPEVKIAEQPYSKEPDTALRVFADGKPPASALTETEFVEKWLKARKDALAALRPTDALSFTNFENFQRNTWRHTLQLDGSESEVVSFSAFGRPGRGDRLEKNLLMPPDEGRLDATIIIAHPEGRSAVGPKGALNVLAARLVNQGYAVLGFDAYQTGQNRRPDPLLFTNFFTTYNRTPFQERVQDTLTACIYARKMVHANKRILVGFGEAGTWALLGGGSVDAVIADVDGQDTESPASQMNPTRFFPGANLLGGVSGGAALLAPKTLVVHNTGGRFNTATIRECYRLQDAAGQFTEEPGPMSNDALFNLIVSLAQPPKKKK